MFRIQYRIWSVLTLFLIGFASLVGPRSAAASTAPDGRFAAYWQANGGLPVFGYAISAAEVQANVDTGRRHLTQWFERNRFELHEENVAPYNVLLGRLGADRLQQLGRNWQRFPKASPRAAHYFGETGHAIAHEPFWRYWSGHGLEFPGQPGTTFDESLALFGLPLSEPAMETNTSGDRVLTQWFERARFEDHGAKGVLLGLLGSEVRGRGAAPTLQYFWPRAIPQGFQLSRDGSSATATAFTLTLTPLAGGPFFAQISGGAGVETPGIPGEVVMVHGQRGMVYTTGDGFSVYWTEAGHPYMVKYGPGVRDVLALAENLEALDLETFQARLQRQEPAGLKYLWPRTSPLTVMHTAGSYADARGFALHLAWPHATEPDATITGGAAVSPPEGSGRSVTIRGQAGSAYVSATRMAVVWNEGGHRYMITSSLREAELLAFAEDLEALDLRTFQARMRQPQEPRSGLKYFWPRTSPLTVWPEGGSYADERSFVLALAWPHATEPDALISGGAIAPPPEGQGAAVRVRGQAGTIHTLGARRALSWTEDGQFYMIYGSLRQNELIALAEDLETIDLATFRARLQPR